MPRGVYKRKPKQQPGTGVQVLKPGELPLEAIPERARPRAQRKAPADQRVMLAREMLYVMKRILDGS